MKNIYWSLTACSLIAFITMHSNAKLLRVQFEFIGACFPLADICIDQVALCESNMSFCINENNRVSPETTNVEG